MISKKSCSIEQCDFPVFEKSYCFYHYKTHLAKKSGLKRTPLRKISNLGVQKRKEKSLKTKELHNWFLNLWDKLADNQGNITCYESGKMLKKEIYRENSCVYSHCLPKSLYPEYAMEDWNILIVHPDIHNQYEMDKTKTPKMLAYLNKIKKEHGII